PIDQAALYIVTQFRDAWSQYEELDDVPLADSSSSVVETLTGTETTVEDGDHVHRISAYNDPAMIDEYGDKTDAETDRVHGYEKTTTRKDYAGDVERLYKQAKRSTLNRVIYDIGTF